MYYVYMRNAGTGPCTRALPVDVQKRLSTHNRGKGAKYTRSRLPVRLVYQETQPDKSAALKRELEIKGLTRARSCG